jgi:hypothetical protein
MARQLGMRLTMAMMSMAAGILNTKLVKRVQWR